MNSLESATEICKVCCGVESVKDLTVKDVLAIKPALFKKVAKVFCVYHSTIFGSLTFDFYPSNTTVNVLP